ncbi:hypothetical protein ACIQD5_10655 [Streptomyces microflavus]|uniref:hypothetical protein n=1 Tax=Streptomyces microflavus TaxID=1919 RepID=UPI003826D792
MDPKTAGTIVTAVATVTAAVLVATFQFAAKMREERRLARVALVEADARIAASFVDLMSRAHARGTSELSVSATEVVLQTGPLVDQLRSQLASQLTGPTDPVLLKRVDDVLDVLQLRVHAVGFAEQEAAMQAVVALGLQHPLLTQAAFTGLKDRNSFHPVWNFSDAEKALKARLQHDGQRFRPRRPDRPEYWFRRGRS